MEARLRQQVETEPLFTIRWRVDRDILGFFDDGLSGRYLCDKKNREPESDEREAVLLSHV